MQVTIHYTISYIDESIHHLLREEDTSLFPGRKHTSLLISFFYYTNSLPHSLSGQHNG